MEYLIIGIDPGIVHTGLVSMLVSSKPLNVTASSVVIDGTDVGAVVAEVERLLAERPDATPLITVEKYDDRGTTFSTHGLMREMETLLKQELPKHTRFLSNTGVKKVIKQPLMMLLDVWVFNQTTHHQDLRSAARIGLYGAVKHDGANTALAAVVRSRLMAKQSEGVQQ